MLDSLGLVSPLPIKAHGFVRPDTSCSTSHVAFPSAQTARTLSESRRTDSVVDRAPGAAASDATLLGVYL